MTLVEAVKEFIFSRKGAPVHVTELYAHLPEEHEHSLRARIYENLGKLFKRVGRGLYIAVDGEASCVVVEGDAWQEVKHLETESIDCLITDPPYAWLDAVLKIHTTTRPRMRWDFDRKEIDRELGYELWRVLKKGAHAFFFVPAETQATRPHVDRFIQLLESCGFTFNKRFIWYKQKLGMGYNGRCSYEGILFMSKGRRRKPCDLAVPDVISVKSIDSRLRKQPCEKPLPLLESLVRFATRTGEVILDCFAGSLSAGMAAIGLGRHAILVEKDARTVEAAIAAAGL